MKFCVAALLAGCVVSQAALADGAPHTWAGPYVGLQVGGAGGGENDDQSLYYPAGGGGAPPPPPPLTNVQPPVNADHFSVGGFALGAHAGYNYQINQLVLGVEGDIDGTTLRGNHNFSYQGGAFSGNYKFDSDVQGSLRLRAGLAWDQWLLYATGGLALAQGNIHVTGINAGAPVDSSGSNLHTGGTIGGGVEYAFTAHWIGRVEVRYSNFGGRTYDLVGQPVKASWDQTAGTVGVSYQF
jgi:outer membrane immunogenic protein